MFNKTSVLLLLILGLLIWIRFPSGKPTIALSPSPSPHVFSQEVLWNLIQEWRDGSGKKKYEIDESLCRIAEKRIPEIRVDWSHNGFHKFLSSWTEFNSLGENLAKDIKYESQMLDQWLASPKHRENLDKNYTHSCLRCSDGYCVQIFGRF